MKISSLFSRDAWDGKITKTFKKFFVDYYTKTYYYHGQSTWHNSYWMGVKTLKTPNDLWIYQELIHQFKPDFILETGTFQGGSANYMASVCDLIGHGHVITMDINECEMEHPRVTKLVHPDGSTGDFIKNKVTEMVGNGKCLVMLDSTHRKQHVLDEMEFFQQFVPKDWYMIVEDTHLGGNPILHNWGDGPMDSVKEFVKRYDTFEIDRSKEKFMLTFNPKGYLRRIR